MKRLFLIFSFLLAAGIFTAAQAQMCGKYTTTLIVYDENARAINNAAAQLIPLGEDETKGHVFEQISSRPNEFRVWFYEGHQLKEKYKAIVSAHGYKTTEKELSFPHCENQKFVIPLEKDAKDETEDASIQACPPAETPLILPPLLASTGKDARGKSVVSGTVIDEGNAPVGEVEIILTGKKSAAFKALSNGDGKYRVEVPPGSYSLTARYTKHSGWQQFSREKLDVARGENKTFDITLIVKKVAGGGITSSDLAAKRKTPVTGSIFDPNGAVILDAEIIFTDRKGKAFKAKPDNDGKYTVELEPSGVYGFPEGWYSVEVKCPAFETFKMERYYVPFMNKGEIRLDITLAILIMSNPIEVIAPSNEKKP